MPYTTQLPPFQSGEDVLDAPDIERKKIILPNFCHKQKFGILDIAAKPSINKIETDNIETTSHFDFFSSSEASLCLQVLKGIKSKAQTLFIPIPHYAQDKILADRISHYIQLPRTKSVIINAENLTAKEIISHYVQQLNLEKADNIYHEFARLMTHYFKHGNVLHSVIYNAHCLSKQDFDYLYELSSLIYERFPKQRHKPLMQFIFIGDKSILPTLRKKTSRKLCQILLPLLTLTDCMNALYLATPVEGRTALFTHCVQQIARNLQIATAGYPALLRHLLPLLQIPLKENSQSERYLSEIVNHKISDIYKKELSLKRFLLKKPRISYRKIYYCLLLCVITTIIISYAYLA
ncbi:MAG: hypothetical protein ACJARD_000828 [Alphaproteobacteria bacterium]|jgi:hypothetical protein